MTVLGNYAGHSASLGAPTRQARQGFSIMNRLGIMRRRSGRFCLRQHLLADRCAIRRWRSSDLEIIGQRQLSEDSGAFSHIACVVTVMPPAEANLCRGTVSRVEPPVAPALSNRAGTCDYFL